MKLIKKIKIAEKLVLRVLGLKLELCWNITQFPLRKNWFLILILLSFDRAFLQNYKSLKISNKSISEFIQILKKYFISKKQYNFFYLFKLYFFIHLFKRDLLLYDPSSIRFYKFRNPKLTQIKEKKYKIHKFSSILQIILFFKMT